MLAMRDEALLGVRRNDNKWYSEAELEAVVDSWRYVIVPPPPVVPRDKDRGAIPVLALPDRVDDRRYPRRTFGTAAARVIRMQVVGGIDPRDSRKIAG